MLKIKKGVIIGTFIAVPLILASIAGAITGTHFANKKGDIEEISKIDASYKYGEGIKISGKAYNSSVTFEYAKLNSSDWSETVPTLVGKYQVRGKSVAHKGYKYSDIQTFEITPLDASVTIPYDTVDYGKKVGIQVDGLLKGDNYTQDYEINYSTLIEEDTVASVKEDTFKIYNTKAEDVTSCYNITFTPKELTFNPQAIEISFANATRSYDGTPLRQDEYTITKGSLFYGDQIVIGGGESITEPGEIENSHTISIVDKDGNPNNNYIPSISHHGKLEIKKIPLQLSSPDLVKVYDGEPFDENAFTLNVSSGLLPNHEIVPTFNSYLMSNYKVLESTVDFTYAIYDKNTGEHVEHFYEEKYCHFGTYKINRREITIQCGSIDVYFDNDYHSNNSYQITDGSVAFGDEIRRVESSVPEFGKGITETQNLFEFQFFRGEENVTNCYKLTTNPGSVLIRPITVDVTFNAKAPVIYDGNPHEIYDAYNPVIEGIDEELLSGKYHYSVNLAADNLMTTYKVDDYRYNENQLNISIFDSDNLPITDNFKINYHFGSTRIIRRDVTITQDDYEKFYDARYLSQDLGFMSYSIDNIASTDYLAVDGLISENAVNVSSGDLILSFSIINSSTGINVTDNYNILDIVRSQYQIKGIPITVEIGTNGLSKTYDDSNVIDLSYVTLQITSGSLQSGDYIYIDNSINYYLPSSDVGNYPFEIPLSSIHITNDNEERRQNYDITLINNGVYSIIKKDAWVVQSDHNEIHQDEIIHGFNNSNDFYATDLVDTHTIHFPETFNINLPDEYYYYSDPSDIEATFNALLTPQIISSDNRDVTHNYNIHYQNYITDGADVYYKYTIHKKHITVITGSSPNIGGDYLSNDCTKVYDNTPLDPDFKKGTTLNYTYYLDAFDWEDPQDLFSGDYLSLTKVGDRPTNVADTFDTSKNQFDFDVKIFNKNGVDNSDNYIITKVTGSLEITKCNLTVNTVRVDRQYNSNPINIGSGTFNITTSLANGVYLTQSSDKVPYGHSLTATLSHDYGSEVYKVGRYEIDANISLTYQGLPYNPDNINLNIKSDQFSCYIVEKHLSIVTSDIYHQYDPNRPAPESRTVEGLAGNDCIYFGNMLYEPDCRYYDSVTDKFEVGIYNNEVGPYVIKRGNVDITNCYNIEISIGRVEIYTMTY